MKIEKFEDQEVLGSTFYVKIEKFEDKKIWKEAKELNKLIFRLTSKEPFSRDFKFSDQIRRAG
ncbi:MAG: four helix bundle protein [Bacteroidales bacterium]|nr:four helix bundle protein [Saprospiraceae bacterium]MCF8381564.1 four helix bundle protein [Bacteroidales bacterium]